MNNLNTKKETMTKNMIRDIALSIADNSYNGHYTIEKYSKSQYRFGFGITESSDISSMFTGNSIEDAMYRAIDFELMKEVKSMKGCNIISRRELIDSAQERQRKCEELEDMIAASNVKYKELVKELDTFKQERKYITNVIDRFRCQWKGNAVMMPFGEKVDVWEKKNLSLFIAFLLEYVERQTGQLEMASNDIPSSKKFGEKKVLTDVKVLAAFHTGSVFEPVWNEIRDTVMDGKWHIYPEIESIIMKYYDHHLTMAAVRQKRQSYFYFARDEKYHDIRGGKDYLFEWKRCGGGNKFRFTTVKEKDDKVPEVSVDTVNKHAIYEGTRDEFISLFCDERYHTYSEAVELFKKYDKYKKYKKKESFYPLIRAYMEHVCQFYQMTKSRKGGVNKFKFDSKRRRLDGKLVTVENAVKCARCGQTIYCDTECMQVKNMFYHSNCYNILNS